MDPLAQVFGEPTRELFRRSSLYAVFDALERFPAWLRGGVLTDLPRLCKLYQGVLEVARGVSATPPPGLEFLGAGGQVRVQGARPEALLALGLTVYFADVEGVEPEVAKLLRNLEEELGVPRQCAGGGLFVNAPGSGLPMHHDSHDQLFFQLVGKKSFTFVPERVSVHPGIPFSPQTIAHSLFGSVYRHGFPYDLGCLEQTEAQTIELAPGSAFFMPAGTLHRTTEQSESCVSFVVAVRAPSKLDLLLNALGSDLQQNPLLRAPSYGYFDPAHVDEEFKGLIAEARTALESLSTVELPRAWLARHHQEGTLRNHSGTPFSEYLRVPSTVVHWELATPERIRVYVRPVNCPQAFVLELAAAAQPIVTHLMASHSSVTVAQVAAQFPDFEEDEVRGLLDQLARVGLLRPLPFAG